jgi:ABC-2 type transport system ATP-binding protein
METILDSRSQSSTRTPGTFEQAANGAGRELLTLRGITKAWAGRPVLDGLDLGLEAGTISWLAGANGAGKTTLLRIAAGIIDPDGGTVELCGLRPRRHRRRFRRRLGFLSAGDRGLYGRLPAGEHLELWASLSLLSRSQARLAIERMVDCLSLADLLPVRADRLSMGQRQRLRLAMAFLHEPDVVFLDEPLNSLDTTGADSLRHCLHDLAARGGAALWCSPGTDRDAAPFDCRYWLESGALLAE